MSSSYPVDIDQYKNDPRSPEYVGKSCEEVREEYRDLLEGLRMAKEDFEKSVVAVELFEEEHGIR
jgi:hypothetical protein